MLKIIKGYVLRNKIKLGMIEKFYLYIRGRNDAKKARFQDYNTGKIFDNTEYLLFDNSEKAPKIVSSFILTELNVFNSYRNFFLRRVYCIFKLFNKKEKKCIRIMPFSKAIIKIDNQINNFESKIEIFSSNYENDISLLKNNYTYLIKKEHNTEHIVQLYENKKSDISKEYHDKVIYYCDIIIFLLNEKIRLIEVMKIELSTLSQRHFLKIRYYYEKAREILTRLPIASITDKNLIEYCNSTIMGDFEEILKQTYEKRETLKEFKEKKVKINDELFIKI